MKQDIPPGPEPQEYQDRIRALFESAIAQRGDWDAVFIVDKVNQYYLTGTMQDGVFILLRDGSYAYFVRRSVERARLESRLENIYPMNSYGDIKSRLDKRIENVFLETEVITYGMLQRMKKHFDFSEIIPADRLISRLRSVKSTYELAVMEESGRQHQYLLEAIVPGLLKEGMNEAEFTAQMYAEMVKLGYQGITRFAMFQTEIIGGQFGFGENSLYPTSFDGPGGMKGMCPAAPIIGDRERLLNKGDLVFVDIGYGINGYHTDRTQVYMFGAKPPEWLERIHGQCKQIQKQTAGLLKPGGVPADIYRTVMDVVPPEFLPDFMGFSGRTVKFLGHGVGLQVDEYPAIAAGFTEPLVENTTLAVEPKKGVKGFGMVGVEDTYVVTGGGGRCVTGGEKDIISVY